MLMHEAKGLAACLLLSALSLAACAQVDVAQQDPVVPPISALAQASPALPGGVWIDPDIPAEIFESILREFGLRASSNPSSSDCIVEAGSRNLVGTWVYALVAPFSTTTDDIEQYTLARKWKNHSADFPVQQISVARDQLAFLSSKLGVPDDESVKIVAQERLLEEAWRNPHTWAIVPFGQIRPEWKVVSISRINPIEKQFDSAGYLLSIPFSLRCRDQASQGPSAQEITNRDSDRLTTLILTGTTAMVRGTAAFMETKGTTYPASDVRGILREADFLHVSNEIAYTPGCPLPWLNTAQEKLRFCSAPKYNELLEDIGSDIIELTGDHFNDWGSEAMLYTLDLYRSRGWQYYGGGYTLADGREPLLIEHNGSKIAFLGCNAKPPGYATASAGNPGAVHCDFDDLTARIRALKEQGYLPIVTFQHIEYDEYGVSPALQVDFRKVAEAGAQIVSGSQAHQPQAIEFHGGSFLHYGLGNLFFDQYDLGLPTRQAFMDRHVFYAGKYINTQLLTIMFTDYARPRLMTAEERRDLLRTIFDVSIWPYRG